MDSCGCFFHNIRCLLSLTHLQVARVVPNTNPAEADNATSEQDEPNDEESGTATLAEDYHIYGDIIQVRSFATDT
jgi:hypothetical protein